jgi:hypothetical protein
VRRRVSGRATECRSFLNGVVARTGRVAGAGCALLGLLLLSLLVVLHTERSDNSAGVSLRERAHDLNFLRAGLDLDAGARVRRRTRPILGGLNVDDARGESRVV